MSMIIKEHSVVRLTDGREGTVIMVHTDPAGIPIAYMIETKGGIENWPSVTIDQIEKILWEPK